jgi:hypothetical protein
VNVKPSGEAQSKMIQFAMAGEFGASERVTSRVITLELSLKETKLFLWLISWGKKAISQVKLEMSMSVVDELYIFLECWGMCVECRRSSEVSRRSSELSQKLVNKP